MSCCDPCADLASIKSDLAELKAKMTLLLQHCGPQTPPGGGGAGEITVDAVTFNGTNDYLTRGSDFTSNADGSQFILSTWVRLAAAPGSFTIVANTDGWVFIGINASGFYCAVFNEAADRFLDVTDNTVSLGDGNWHHIALSIDTNFAAGNKLVKLAIDGTAKTPTVTDGDGAFNIDFTQANWAVGATTSAAELFNGDMAELYLALNQYLDVTQAANNQKFRSSGGKPVNLGADGSTPTGTAPTVYLHLDDGEAAANFAANAGSGGGMTVNGALATAATSPSD